MPYEDFPWFKDLSVAKILNVEKLTPGHFYWPDLDVDLALKTIEHPERFPLKSPHLAPARDAEQDDNDRD